MSSFADSPRLPVIDLSLFDVGGTWRDHVAAQVDWAASEFGFFYIVGHGIETGVIDSLLTLSRTFFEQSAEAKHRVHMSRGGRAWRGYFPVGGELTSGRPDLKEGIYFGAELDQHHPEVQAGTPLHGPNLFPASIPGFRSAVLEYMEAMTQLGHILMAGISLSLGFDESYLA